MTQALKRVNKPLYYQVKQVLAVNKQERHIRGGEATRQKYIKEDQKKLRTERID